MVVPNGTHRPGSLATELARLHPDVEIGSIWCGDPHLRPTGAGHRWWDDEVRVPGSAAELGWHQALLASESLDAEWRAGLRTARSLLGSGAPTVTLLWVGAVAVLGDISTLWADTTGFTVVPRVTSPLPADGAVPDAAALAEHGRFATHMVTFGSGSIDVVDWLVARLDDDAVERTDDGDPTRRAEGVGVARWLEVAADMFAATSCGDERIGVGAWRWDTDLPALLDVPGFDPDTPWVLDPRVGRRTRVTTVGHPDRLRALELAAGQLVGERLPLTAPGGIELDAVSRRSARRAVDPPPSPWTEPARFRDWLADRYWSELHSARRDLMVAFPRPTSNDATAFRSWSRRAMVDDRVAMLVPPVRDGQATHTRFETPKVLRDDGVNLVGYLRRESSLGDVARRVARALADADVATSMLPHERTASPLLAHPPATDRRIEFATTLAVVNADQFMTLEVDHPELLAATRRMIGYWFWELEHIPPGMRAIFPMVDEIWAGSKFVADAFAAVATVPVRHVPIPIPRPDTSGRDRSSFDVLRPFGDRFVFTVVFDHFSVTERKNPVGAIEAFRRAFTPGEGPVLVVKTMNGARRWPQHQHVLAAADGRADIVVWDEHLSRDDHMAFIAAADALVSLHRSEGLGLHLAEAMWLGTPTIATHYSGNLDFMDDDCALLVDHRLVGVQGGEGVYPPVATWADPDLDAAAAAMRALATDPALHARLAAAGRSRMEHQPSLADTGRLIARLLGLDTVGHRTPTSSVHTEGS